jgi:tetratricopeptide (TPR) repeat protein
MNNVAVLLNNQGVNLLTKTVKDAATHNNICNNNNNNKFATTTMNTTDLDRATSYFEQALALILRNTEIHKHQGDFFFYESDEQGMIQYEDENIGAQLTNKLNIQDFIGVQTNNDNGIDDIIHESCWKAVKIGHDDDDDDDDNDDDDENDTNNMNIDDHHNINKDGGEYRYLSTSIFHSMICIYNLGLCYQYKGIQTSSRSLLEAAVDHYMQAYELATRFRLQNINQYMLVMATMNNLATTYSILNDEQRRDVCNSYLLSTLMLLTTSEEGQEEISASASAAACANDANSKDMLRRRGRQTTFRSFMSNVSYLILQDNVASAA